MLKKSQKVMEENVPDEKDSFEDINWESIEKELELLQSQSQSTNFESVDTMTEDQFNNLMAQNIKLSDLNNVVEQLETKEMDLNVMQEVNSNTEEDEVVIIESQEEESVENQDKVAMMRVKAPELIRICHDLAKKQDDDMSIKNRIKLSDYIQNRNAHKIYIDEKLNNLYGEPGDRKELSKMFNESKRVRDSAAYDKLMVNSIFPVGFTLTNVKGIIVFENTPLEIAAMAKNGLVRKWIDLVAIKSHRQLVEEIRFVRMKKNKNDNIAQAFDEYGYIQFILLDLLKTMRRRRSSAISLREFKKWILTTWYKLKNIKDVNPDEELSRLFEKGSFKLDDSYDEDFRKGTVKDIKNWKEIATTKSIYDDELVEPFYPINVNIVQLAPIAAKLLDKNAKITPFDEELRMGRNAFTKFYNSKLKRKQNMEIFAIIRIIIWFMVAAFVFRPVNAANPVYDETMNENCIVKASDSNYIFYQVEEAFNDEGTKWCYMYADENSEVKGSNLIYNDVMDTLRFAASIDTNVAELITEGDKKLERSVFDSVWKTKVSGTSVTYYTAKNFMDKINALPTACVESCPTCPTCTENECQVCPACSCNNNNLLKTTEFQDVWSDKGVSKSVSDIFKKIEDNSCVACDTSIIMNRTESIYLWNILQDNLTAIMLGINNLFQNNVAPIDCISIFQFANDTHECYSIDIPLNAVECSFDGKMFSTKSFTCTLKKTIVSSSSGEDLVLAIQQVKDSMAKNTWLTIIPIIITALITTVILLLIAAMIIAIAIAGFIFMRNSRLTHSKTENVINSYNDD